MQIYDPDSRVETHTTSQAKINTISLVYVLEGAETQITLEKNWKLKVKGKNVKRAALAREPHEPACKNSTHY